MGYEPYIAIDGARAETPLLATQLETLAGGADRARTGADAKPGRYIALVESRTFMRDCLHRGMQASLSLPVVTFSTLSELESQFSDSIALVFLCLADARQADCANALKLLSALDSSIPIVVLATVNDMELAKTAINFGAKGYIPCTANFEIAIEAVRIHSGRRHLHSDRLLACLWASQSPGGPSRSANERSVGTRTQRRSRYPGRQVEQSHRLSVMYLRGHGESAPTQHHEETEGEESHRGCDQGANVVGAGHRAPKSGIAETVAAAVDRRLAESDMPSARRFPREKPARQVGFTLPNTFRRRVARRRPLSRVSAGAPLRADDNGPKSPSRSRRLDSKTSNPTREPATIMPCLRLTLLVSAIGA